MKAAILIPGRLFFDSRLLLGNPKEAGITVAIAEDTPLVLSDCRANHGLQIPVIT